MGAVLVGDDAGDVRPEHELDSGQRNDEQGAQRFVGIVDGADLVERSSLPEVIVAEVRSLLEVSGVPGETIVIGRSKKSGANDLVIDSGAPTDLEGDLLVQGQIRLHTAPREERGPSHLSMFERLGRGSIAFTIADAPDSRQPTTRPISMRDPGTADGCSSASLLAFWEESRLRQAPTRSQTATVPALSVCRNATREKPWTV